MADVFVTQIGRWVVLFAIIRLGRMYEYGGWLAAIPWAAVCLAAWRWRAAHAVLAVFAAAASLTFVPHNGITSVAWMAGAVALFSGRDLLLVLRVKATAVYGFTAAHKMIGPFASGGVLASTVPWLPYPRYTAAVVIFAEALLGVATWRRWPWAFPMAVLVHAGILFGVAQTPYRFATLIAWQLTMPVLVYYVTRVD